ncbi:MAG: hypothetical protein Q8Q48_04365 [Candidatus Staskawiczbacteria bacterium]|nr:hypothetical protein [Candidatus Staskawiczbacteria bacterium]
MEFLNNLFKKEREIKEINELKYFQYGKSFTEQFGRNYKNIHDIDWKTFLREWNNWSEEEKQEYLYYLSFIDGRMYLRWAFWFVIIISFLIGLNIKF